MSSIIKKDLLDFINRESKNINCISEVKAALEMLSDSLANLKNSLSDNLPDLSRENNYQKIEEYISYFKELDSYLCFIQDTKHSIQTTFPQQNPTISKITPEVSNSAEKLAKISLKIIDTETICPICQVELSSTQTSYSIYFDKDLQKFKKQARVETKNCSMCRQLYIKRIDFNRIEGCTGLDYTNLVCKEIEKKKQTCSFWGCQSTELYRDGLCKEHYSYEHYESK